MLQSNPTPNNQALLQVIAPGSVPWKIVHVVRAWETAGDQVDVMAEFLKRHPGWKPRRFKLIPPKARTTAG